MRKIPSKSSEGFSLIELAVVMAGLTILASLAIPNVIKYFDSANVDEIKALLNSAAADCLQKKRSEDDPVVDDEIISDDIIKKSGFQINRTSSILNQENKPKCSLLLLEPIKGDGVDLTRYNIGFQLLSNGKLDKLASTEMETKRPDCIKWAGKCKVSECAKKLEDYKNEIRAARDTCNEKLKKWKNTMNPERYQQWDSSKGPDGPDTCPLAPPDNLDDDTCDTSYQGSNKCNTDGCNLPIWGLWNDETDTGTTYDSETEYKKWRDILIGEKCAKQIKEEYEDANPPFTNPSSAGVPLSECKNDLYWFVDGESQGDEQTWKKSMCEKNKQDKLNTIHSGPIEYCDISPIYIIDGEEILPDASREDAKQEFDNRIANNKELRCSNLLREDAKGKTTPGPHVSPTPGDMEPIVGEDCGVTYWYCKESGKIYKGQGAEDDYNEDQECQNSCVPRNAYFCNLYKNDFWCCGG
jgi:type II secretory pathway pseudopilin PulG